MEDKDWEITHNANGDWSVKYLQTDMPEQKLTYTSFIEVDGEMYYEKDVRMLLEGNVALKLALDDAVRIINEMKGDKNAL